MHVVELLLTENIRICKTCCPLKVISAIFIRKKTWGNVRPGVHLGKCKTWCPLKDISAIYIAKKKT